MMNEDVTEAVPAVWSGRNSLSSDSQLREDREHSASLRGQKMKINTIKESYK